METKKSLTQEQKSNILAVIIIVLIIGVVFYFKSGRTTEDSVDKVSVDNLEGTGASDSNIDDLLMKDDKAEPTKTQTKTQTQSNKEKFSLALANGSKAFLAKEYDKAIKYDYEALSYINSDLAYIRLFDAYNALNDIDNARLAMENALKLNPSNTDYWVTKIIFLDEKTGVSYQDLKRIYEEGIIKGDYRTKINLITAFARVAENNQQKADAIKQWEEAIKNYPSGVESYQAEITRLKTI